MKKITLLASAISLSWQITIAQTTILQFKTFKTPQGVSAKKLFTHYDEATKTDSEQVPSKFWLLEPGKINIDSLNRYLYNQNNISTMQSFSLQNFNGVHTDINAEFVSFLFGPVRMGVSGTFQSKSDTSKDNAIKSSLQKIITNGGYINLNFTVPIYFVRKNNEQVHFGIFGQLFNGLSPGVNNTGTIDYSTNLSYTNQTGLNFHFDVGSNDNKARLTFDIPCFYSISSNNVNKELSLSNFGFVRLQVGAVIGDLLNFHIAGPIYSTSTQVQHAPFLLSLQFSPTQILKSR